MSYCNHCGGFPHECECAVLDEVVGCSSLGYPVNAAGEIVAKQCTPEQRRQINDALTPRPQLLKRQAG